MYIQVIEIPFTRINLHAPLLDCPLLANLVSERVNRSDAPVHIHFTGVPKVAEPLIIDQAKAAAFSVKKVVTLKFFISCPRAI